MENNFLKVEILDGVLTMSIGMEELKASIESGRLDTSCDGRFVINDLEAFGVDLVHELKCEEEDGSTPVHIMLDCVAMITLENGGVGCEISDVDE